MAGPINVFHDCIDDFKLNYCANNDGHFRIAQWNIRGMNEIQKFDNIPLFLENIHVPIDVFIVGETWLKSENCAVFEIPGYNSIFSCRETSSGGLAMYVKIGLSFNVIKNETTDGFHLIHVRIKRNGIFYEVVGLYRPPSFDFNRFSIELENIMAVQNNSTRFFVGDMNIPINLSNNNIVVRYKSLLESYNYACSNTFVTRPASNNTLDHFVCNNDDLENIRNDTVYTDVSDHLIVVSTLKVIRPKEYRVLTRKLIDKVKLNVLFTNFLNDFECSHDVNNSITTITEVYHNLLEQCTKIKSENVNIKSKHCPWINYYVWQWIKLKHKYLKKLKNDPLNDHLKDLLKHVSKRADDAKRKCKNEYYKNLLETTCHAKLWKNLNEIMGRSKPVASFELQKNGIKTSNNLEVCEIFNNFFSQIGTNLAKNIPRSNTNPMCNVNRIDQSVFLRPAHANEVTKIISELKVKKKLRSR
jgi:hypothetical protein